jgi:hypothetical protein
MIYLEDPKEKERRNKLKDVLMLFLSSESEEGESNENFSL